jgi:hypothetical protein
VQGRGEDAVPLWRLGRDLRGRFAPNVDLTVVGGGGEEDAVFGVGPGDAPDSAFVAAEGLDCV